MMTYKQFCELIEHEKNKKPYEALYVIMSFGYTKKEANESNYRLELLDYGMGNYEWLNDWYEGQQYIDLYGVYTENEIIEIIQKYNFDHGSI